MYHHPSIHSQRQTTSTVSTHQQESIIFIKIFNKLNHKINLIFCSIYLLSDLLSNGKPSYNIHQPLPTIEPSKRHSLAHPEPTWIYILHQFRHLIHLTLQMVIFSRLTPIVVLSHLTMPKPVLQRKHRDFSHVKDLIMTLTSSYNHNLLSKVL